MQLGVDCHVLSIDDFYLSKAKRKRLAASVHPLLAIRGVPGTHDVPRLLDALADFIEPSVQSVTVPIFDKLKDDRTRKVHKIQKSAKPTLFCLKGGVSASQRNAHFRFRCPRVASSFRTTTTVSGDPM